MYRENHLVLVAGERGRKAVFLFALLSFVSGRGSSPFFLMLFMADDIHLAAFPSKAGKMAVIRAVFFRIGLGWLSSSLFYLSGKQEERRLARFFPGRNPTGGNVGINIWIGKRRAGFCHLFMSVSGALFVGDKQSGPIQPFGLGLKDLRIDGSRIVFRMMVETRTGGAVVHAGITGLHKDGAIRTGTGAVKVLPSQ